jgi:hypothetical protein
MQISLTGMNAEDVISIRTKTSEYHFLVTDPGLCRGILTGGVLGQQPHDAFLVGAIFPLDEGIRDPKKLETGARALFYLNRKHGLDCLTTSVITELSFRSNESLGGHMIQRRATSEDASVRTPPRCASPSCGLDWDREHQFAESQV